jgi:hypothetical protein
MDGKERKPVIYASEIGQYHFCPVSWYLKRCGFTSNSPNLSQGRHKHTKYGRIIQKRNFADSWSRLILIGGNLGILISLALLFFEVFL